jgi:exopolysaccharide biosynthesis polyprenyl glycosylphosphotransferase
VRAITDVALERSVKLSRFGLDRHTSDGTRRAGHSLSQDTITLSETVSETSDPTRMPSIELRDGTDGMTVAPPVQEPRRELRIYRIPLTPSQVRPRRSGLVLVLADVLCCLVTVTLGRSLASSVRPDLSVLFVAALAIWCSAFGLFGLYRAGRSSEELRLLVGGVAIGVLGIDLLVAAKSFSGPRLLVLIVCGWTLEVTARALARAWRKASRQAVRTLIIGMNPESANIAVRLKAPGSRHYPLGYIAVAPTPASFDGLPILGTLERLDEVVRHLQVECLCLAGSSMNREQVRIAMRVAREHGLELRVSTLLPSMRPARVGLEEGEDGVWLTMPRGLTRTQGVIKRAFDILGACTLLVASSPVLIAVAIGVRLTSRGPVFYRQPRVTQGGRVFRMFKFRTMIQDADGWFKEKQIDLTVPFFKLLDEGPVTRIGSFLRRTSLDELPQLFDVLRGEMSLVGPRPLPLAQVQSHPELLGPRHEVKAGLTGWWQVMGRNQFDPEESVELDLFYIENWSFALDLSILARTVPAMFIKVDP